MPQMTEKPRNSDFFVSENPLVDEIHKTEDNFIKFMNFSKDPTENTRKSIVNETPSRKSLAKYNNYPYEPVRKSNISPASFSTPLKNSDDFSNLHKSPNFIYNNSNLISSNKCNENNNDNNNNQKEIEDLEKNNTENHYRNIFKPDSEISPLETSAKDNKPIENSSGLEIIIENFAIKALIKDVEKQNNFFTEVNESWLKSINKVKIPKNFKNTDFVRLAVNYLLKLAKFNEKLNEIKMELMEQSDFNLIDYFGFFDIDKKGFCLLGEFHYFLKEQAIEIEPEALGILIKRFDRKKLQKLRFADFEKLMTSPGYKENDKKPTNIQGFDLKYQKVGFFCFLWFFMKNISFSHCIREKSSRN